MPSAKGGKSALFVDTGFLRNASTANAAAEDEIGREIRRPSSGLA